MITIKLKEDETTTLDKWQGLDDLVIHYSEPVEGKRLVVAQLKLEWVFMHGITALINNANVKPVVLSVCHMPEENFPKTEEEWKSEEFTHHFVVPCKLELEKFFWGKLKRFEEKEDPKRFDYSEGPGVQE